MLEAVWDAIWTFFCQVLFVAAVVAGLAAAAFKD